MYISKCWQIEVSDDGYKAEIFNIYSIKPVWILRIWIGNKSRDIKQFACQNNFHWCGIILISRHFNVQNRVPNTEVLHIWPAGIIMISRPLICQNINLKDWDIKHLHAKNYFHLLARYNIKAFYVQNRNSITHLACCNHYIKMLNFSEYKF